jgi:hypothetical protein
VDFAFQVLHALLQRLDLPRLGLPAEAPLISDPYPTFREPPVFTVVLREGARDLPSASVSTVGGDEVPLATPDPGPLFGDGLDNYPTSYI